MVQMKPLWNINQGMFAYIGPLSTLSIITEQLCYALHLRGESTFASGCVCAGVYCARSPVRLVVLHAGCWIPLLSAPSLATIDDSPLTSVDSGSLVRSSPLAKTVLWVVIFRRWNIPVALRVTGETIERRECVDVLEPLPSPSKGVSTSTVVTDPVAIAFAEILPSSRRRLCRQ